MSLSVDMEIVEPHRFGFGRLFEHTHDAVIVADAYRGRIVLWNPAATQLFGYSLQEVQTLPLVALVPEQFRQHHLAALHNYSVTCQRSLSLRDALTELYNRRYLEEALSREVHRSLLRAIGDVLQAHTRDEDIACRYGGEEFCLVLPGIASVVLMERAEVIRGAIKALQINHRGTLIGQVTCSVGNATFPQNGATMEQVMEAADQALYRAKREGRDRVVAG